MTQYKDIPLATDQRNVSQSDIRNNFNYLCTPLSGGVGTNGILPVDHQASGDNAAEPKDGFHQQISFINYLTTHPPDPAPTTLVNAVNGASSDAIAYTKFVRPIPSLPASPTNPNASQLFYFNGVVPDYQITPSQVVAFNLIQAFVGGVFTTILIVPNNCIGKLIAIGPANVNLLIDFYSIDGTAYFVFSFNGVAIQMQSIGTAIQIKPSVNVTYDYKYWWIER